MYETGTLAPMPPTLGSMSGSVVSQLPPLSQASPEPTHSAPSPLDEQTNKIDPNFMNKAEVKRRVDIAQQQGIDPKIVINEMINRGYTLEGLNDGNNEQYEREQIRIKQQPAQELAQGAIKGMPLNQGEKKEWNDGLIPRANPLFKYNPEKDNGAPNAMKLIGNAIPSAYNVVADVGNMALNPLDTAKGLLQTIAGVGANVGKRGLSQFDEDAPEIVDQRIDELKNDQGIVGWMVRAIDSSEEVADAVGEALKERYGGSENIAKTMTEDPVGVISDIALIFETGGAGLSKVAKMGGATKVADVASDVSRFANKYDPYNMAMEQGIKGVGQGMQKVGGVIKQTAESLSSVPQKAFDRIRDETIGLSKKEVTAIQSNPYQAEYRERIKKEIDISGLPQEGSQLLKPLYEEITGSVISQLDELSSRIADSGPLYDEVKKLKTTINMQNVHANLQDMLTKNNILFKSDGSLDFSKSKFIQGRDTNAITSVFNRIMGQDNLGVTDILNLRKAIDSATKRDGAPIGSTGLLKQIRKLVDNEAKEKIPQLKELDELYRKQIKEISAVKDGLNYRQGGRKGRYRDNIIQIIKTIGSENRGKMRARLLKVMPDLVERIDAVNNLWRMAKAYESIPKYGKNITATTAGVTGAMIGYGAGGVAGAIIGGLGSGIVGFLVDGVLSDVRKTQIDKILSEMSPQALQKLKEINGKIESNGSLSMDEVKVLDRIKAKIQAEQQKEQGLKTNPIPAPPLKDNPIPPTPNKVKNTVAIEDVSDMSSATMTKQTSDRVLTDIAKEHFFVDTLETRNRDRLDFHEVSVWGVESALTEVFEKYSGGFPPKKSVIKKIAKKYFDIDTLETQHSDRLDFHDVAVWSIKEALEEMKSLAEDNPKKYGKKKKE